MAPQGHPADLANRALCSPVAGSVVVCGAPLGAVYPAVLRTLARTRLCLQPVAADLSPQLTSASTRAIVFVVDDVDEGLRGCEALREWAHESLLPIVVVFAGDEPTEALPFWALALAVVRRWELDSVLVPLISALDENRNGLPTARDADLAWEGRCALAASRWSACGHGLATFAAANTLFVGGLARDEAAAHALTSGLDVPKAQSMNFAALRVWNSPSAARPSTERTH